MISLPTRSTALRFCSALLGAAALALPAQAAELTPGKISAFSLSETYADTLKTFREDGETWTEVVTSSKTTLKLTLDLGMLDEETYEYKPLDLSSINEETSFSISLGDFLWEGSLGEDPNYTAGKKSAFIPVNFNDDDKPVGSNGIKLSWTNTKLTVSILRSLDDGDDKGSVWADSLAGLHEEPQTATKWNYGPLNVSFGDVNSADYYWLGPEGEESVPAYLTASIKTTKKTVSEEDHLLDSITVTGGIDTTPPTITLTPPKGGFQASEGYVTLTGKVSDKHGLLGVSAYDGAEGISSATLTYTKGNPETAEEGWWGPTEATWSLTLPVEMGVNQFEIDAVDMSGQYKFVSTEVFQTIPAEFLGRWDALLTEGGGGYLTLTVSPKGAVSGKVTLEGGVSKSFKGIWHGKHFHASADENKASEIYISAYVPEPESTSTRSPQTTAEPLPQMVAQVEYYAGDIFTEGTAIRIPYSSANKLATGSPLIGRFNAAFALEPELNLGTSFFSMVSTNTGAVTVAGRLADGTVFTSSAGLGENGEIPFFTPLYKTGYISSSQQIDAETTDLFENTVQWVRPAKFSDKQFPDGFSYESTSFGELYTPPEANRRILDLDADAATASWMGDLATEGASRAVLVTTKHKITAPSDTAFKATLDPKTGLITGSFKLSTTPALTATYSAMCIGRMAEGFYVAPAPKGQTVKNFGEFSIIGPVEDE